MVAKGLLIGFGILLMGFGMRAAFSGKHPGNTIGALLALTGLGASLVGTLLIFVPDFFS
jgi:hypothetical protein